MAKPARKRDMFVAPGYTLERDQWQWILTRHYEGVDRNGAPKMQSEDKFFGNLDQVARYLVTQSAQGCDTIQEILEAFNRTSAEVAATLKAAVN
jgi:hypothetical protein